MRPIDADILEEKLKNEALGVVYTRAFHIIREMEPLEVKPIVRGKWIKNYFGAGDLSNHKCSNCKGHVDNSYYKFCPYCGANMRGDNNANSN